MTDCPKCRTIELKRPSSGTQVLRCYTCHGMWVTPDEAKVLVAEGSLLDPESMLPQKADGDAISGLCPEGHGIMTRAKVDAAEGFHLERCAHCKGIWFDAGEWTKLATSHLINHIDDLWDPEWQRRRRVYREAELHRDKIRSIVGEELLEALEQLSEQIRSHPRRNEVVAYFMSQVQDA